MKNKKLIYYILVVLLMVVVVGGSTYAYFSAATGNDSEIQGGTASAPELDLKVTKISTNATGNLIPLDNDIENLTKAAKGYKFTGSEYDKTKSCIDKNGYSVCQVYEIKIKNNGTAAVVLDGGVTKLEGENTPNIACAIMESNISVTSNESCMSNTSIANNDKIEADSERKYYMMVYINNLHTEQNDNGDFFGTISFSSINGGVTADFN